MGAFQFSNRLRARYLRLHRALGYAYVTCVMVGASVAIPLAAKISTPSLVAASAVQAFGWMSCTGIALYCIRTGNIQQHRRWMMRGYPFAMVFTVARVFIPIRNHADRGPRQRNRRMDSDCARRISAQHLAGMAVNRATASIEQAAGAGELAGMHRSCLIALTL